MQFKRNGQCLSSGAAMGDAAKLGGCYVSHGATDGANEWSTPLNATPLVSASGGLKVGSAGCAVGSVPVMGNTSSAQGMLGWGVLPGQLILLLCPGQLCAGDAGGLAIMSCDDQGSNGWTVGRP